MTTVLNATLHAELIARGYVHVHREAEWHEMGDAESGPLGLHGHPAFDEYVNDHEYLVVDATGIVHREPRDLVFEAWEELMTEHPTLH